MALYVKSMVQYLTERVERMRDSDYVTQQIVKAVKGRDPGGIQQRLILNGRTFQFGPSAPEGAVDFWTEWAASFIRANLEAPDDPLVLVPVPNSCAIAEHNNQFRTLELAQRIAGRVGGNVIALDELRWTEQMHPANQGGTRQAYELFLRLACKLKAHAATERVLIDDVLTTGGHLQAATAKLRAQGLNVPAALICGRTSHVQIADPYNVPIEELPDFDPTDRFGFGASGNF